MQSHDPDSRIVCRPRPSRYDISIDSTSMRRILYWPSTVSPSFPYKGAPRPSLSTAIFCVFAVSSTPMNFNAIGGSGGGGGGPLGTTGWGEGTTAAVRGAGGGGAGFGLNLNKLRSTLAWLCVVLVERLEVDVRGCDGIRGRRYPCGPFPRLTSSRPGRRSEATRRRSRRPARRRDPRAGADATVQGASAVPCRGNTSTG